MWLASELMFFAGLFAMYFTHRSVHAESWYEWSEKTDWIQETVTAKELGMHRADVLRKRIEDLEKEVLSLKLK